MKLSLELKVNKSNSKFQILEIILSGNGLIEPKEISHITLPKEIDYTKGVIISGKAPVWLFTCLTHLLHIAKWVATFDPRLGAVVVQSHDINSPQTGDIIPPEEITKHLSLPEKSVKNQTKKDQISKVIAVVGPANSGKSVFIRELQKNLKANYPVLYQNDFFLIRACPDGEGDWFGDVSADEGKLFRHKKRFDNEFVIQMTNNIKEIKKTKNLVLIDCGGIIDKKNQQILNECTHSIIVSRDESDIKEWIGALKSSEIELLFQINTELNNVNEKVDEKTYILGPFTRESKNADIPQILIEKIISNVIN